MLSACFLGLDSVVNGMEPCLASLLKNRTLLLFFSSLKLCFCRDFLPDKPHKGASMCMFCKKSSVNETMNFTQV